MTKEKNKNINIMKNIFAPLYVIREEKAYLMWMVFAIFFGLTNLWAAFFMGKLESIGPAMKEGIVYTYAISLCAPFSVDTFITVIWKKREKKSMSFVKYYMYTASINIIFIFICAMLWVGEFKSNIIVQIIIALISTGFAFYMYCIAQMEKHKAIVGKYDDSEYLRREKESMSQTEKSANSLTKIEGGEEDIAL